MTDRKTPQSLGSLLDAALPGPLSRRLPSPGLARAWRRALGEVLARRSWPVALEADGCLIVAVDGAAWMQELGFLAPELPERLAGEGIEIDRVKFIKARGRARPGPVQSEFADLPPLDAGEESQVDQLVAKVKDPELQKALANVMRAQMRARKVHQK